MMKPSRRHHPLSRREFLGCSAAGVALTSLAAGRAQANAGTSSTTLGDLPARVARCRSKHAVVEGNVHERLVEEMLATGLTELTGQASMAAAWRELLTPDDIIGIKFNRSGQEKLGTTPVVASILLKSLLAAGFSARQVVCIELLGNQADLTDQAEGKKTTPPLAGYEEAETEFESGSDQLALALRQVTALIDVPFLKTHNIAGFTCCSKNLSHGLIKHPSRFHDGACAPYIADLIALPAIQSRLRLCVVDALRVVFDNGPEPDIHNTTDAGVLLLGQNPIAVDTIGLGVLNAIRQDAGLNQLAASGSGIPYLAAAGERGLGPIKSQSIETLRLRF
jgi:hypothetical protein